MKKETKQNLDEILEKKISQIQRRREWTQFLIESVVLIAAVYTVLHYVIGIAFVSGNSMEPSLLNGELLVFYRLEKEYRKGDIVIIWRDDNIQYVKRVVACGSEQLELNKEGQLLINGQVESETQPLEDGIAYPYLVPEGDYFVLGDNRKHSMDSRVFGAVSQEEIVGRVFLHLGLVW